MKNFRVQNQIERRVKKFPIFLGSSQGCPHFPKLWKILLHSPLEVSGNAKQIFGRMISVPSFGKKLSDDYSPTVLQTVGIQPESRRLVHFIH